MSLAKIRDPRNCAYCRAEFIPKTDKSTCCSRLHSQAFSKFGRARMDVAAAEDISALPQCCQDYIAGATFVPRTKCPQHQVAQKMRGEELTWEYVYKKFRANHDENWALAGFTIAA